MASNYANLDKLTVRPIRPDERTTWDHLMTSHHYLQSSRLTGESIRYVALFDRRWTALLGWTSAAFKLSERDAWIGWSEQQRLQRLKVIACSARLLVLPDAQIKNMASKALALNLKRLSSDWVTVYKHPIVLAETFIDHSRFTGACYRAAGFLPVGFTKGFGISAGNYYFHGKTKRILLRPLQRKAKEWLRAPFVHPLLMQGSPHQPLLDLNRLNLFQSGGLLERLSALPEWRKPYGKRHNRAIILAMVVCAEIANVVNSYREIGRFIETLSQETLFDFGCSRRYGAPSESTIRRAMPAVDLEKLCQIVTGWLSEQGHHRMVDAIILRIQTLRRRTMVQTTASSSTPTSTAGGDS